MRFISHSICSYWIPLNPNSLSIKFSRQLCLMTPEECIDAQQRTTQNANNKYEWMETHPNRCNKHSCVWIILFMGLNIEYSYDCWHIFHMFYECEHSQQYCPWDVAKREQRHMYERVCVCVLHIGKAQQIKH